MMSRFTFFLLAGVAVSLTLSGCDQYQETNLNQSRAIVEHERFVDEISMSEVDDRLYRYFARDYQKHGGDGLYLSFVYNPRSSHNTAMDASSRAAQASKILRSAGVRDVKTDILPSGDARDEGTLVVSYTRYTARPPEDCREMPGLGDTRMEMDWEYRQGCGIETYLARQVARPKDLLGRGGLPETASGRRAATLLNPHDAGIVNEEIDGESASEQDN